MKNIILIGMPASGKSSILNCYTEHFNGKGIDTDQEIIKEYGDISKIFEMYGEQKFRDIESKVIENCCKNKNCMIATGGGSILREQNIKCFKNSGIVFYLKTPLKTLLDRVATDNTRPLLLGDKKDKITKLYKERASIYEQVADITIDTDNFSPIDILNKILEYMRSL